jgi:hypothetical protein
MRCTAPTLSAKRDLTRAQDELQQRSITSTRPRSPDNPSNRKGERNRLQDIVVRAGQRARKIGMFTRKRTR